MNATSHRAALLAATLALAGCSGVSDTISGGLFGVKELDTSRPPANATLYACDGGKRFYLRLQEDAAWVILPEREFRLDKVSGGSGTRYANRAASLDIDQSGATLVDAPDISFIGCKPSQS